MVIDDGLKMMIHQQNHKEITSLAKHASHNPQKTWWPLLKKQVEISDKVGPSCLPDAI